VTRMFLMGVCVGAIIMGSICLVLLVWLYTSLKKFIKETESEVENEDRH